MQQLHLVGITTDNDGLIFSARRGARSGGFVVPITDELLDSIGQAERLRKGGDAEPPAGSSGGSRRQPTTVRPESRLTPREMQARLRAGHTVSQVARAAGMDEDWVERFAAPIAAEQARVLDTAFAMKALKARAGESALPLAESVRVNLHDKGVPLLPSPEGWTVQTLGEGRWLLRFEYVSRRRTQTAEWELDIPSQELLCRNRLAGDVGYVATARRRIPEAPRPVTSETPAEPTRSAGPAVEAAEAPAPRRGKGRTAKKAATTRKAPAKKAVARKTPARKKAAARKTAARARKAPARKTTARKAATSRKAPARKTAPRKPAQQKRTARKTTARKTTARKAATARKAPARKTAARKPAPQKRTARKTTARKTNARKTTARKAPARKSAARKAPARKAAARKTTARKAPRKRSPHVRPPVIDAPTAAMAVLHDGPEQEWEPEMEPAVVPVVPEADAEVEEERAWTMSADAAEMADEPPERTDSRWRRLARPLRAR